MRSVLAKIATAVVMLVLLVANVTAVLPAPWVFGHLSTRSLLWGPLELHVDPAQPGTFYLYYPDATDGSVRRLWILPRGEPDFLSRYYDRLRTETAARHSRIRFRTYDARTGRVYESEDLPTIDYWAPNAESRFRFVVNDPLELPPGEYMVDAFLYANPPYGPGFMGRNKSALSPIGSMLPGRNILIETKWVSPVKVVVEETASAPEVQTSAETCPD